MNGYPSLVINRAVATLVLATACMTMFGAHAQYPPPGSHTPRLPDRSIPVDFHGDRFYVNAGVWFRDAARGYVVATAPVGAFVPVLPPGCAVVVRNGIRYYLANDVYYAGAVAAPGYVVVPPPGEDPRSPSPLP